MSNPYDFGDSYPPGYGQYPLPSDLTLQQKYALGLLQQGQQASPVAHPLGALARALQGFMGGQALREGQRTALAAQADALRGFTAATGGGGAPGAPGPIAPLPNVGSAPAVPTAGAGGAPMAPLTQMASLSARGETGTADLAKAQANISPDTGGSKSYGFFGLNSGFGQSRGRGSAAQFAQQYPSLGLTAVPGTPEFDAQWSAAASKEPEQLQAAQLDWYQKNILPRVTEGLTGAGVKPEVAADPRVQSYFADRMVQQGPGSTAQHAQRIAAAFQQGGGTPEGFLAAMSAVDKASLGRDFRTYLSARPQDVRGLANRIDLRQGGALGTTAQAGPGIATAPPAPAAAARAPDLRLINPNLPAPLQRVGAEIIKQQMLPPEYDYSVIPSTGQVIAKNKKDPNDIRVITNPEITRSIIEAEAATAGAKTRAESAAKMEVTQEALATFRKTLGPLMVGDIDTAIGQAKGGWLPTTGLVGSWLQNVPIIGQPAQDLSNTLTAIGARISVDQINQMRSLSPGGGALGNVSDKDLTTVRSILGSIEQSQSEAQLTYNLRRLKNEYLDLVDPRKFLPREELGRAPGSQPAAPATTPARPQIPPGTVPAGPPAMGGWGKAEVVR